ncbi:MAG: ACT domain-containing protein [Clostridia bacterium]|nr:ACT domain-containing protein [Clostridia bacterium]
MRIQQLSVFLENKPGHLCRMTDLLAAGGINISAISLADTSGFGIVRMIVDSPEEAKRVLSDAGIIGKITEVSAIAMNDSPGGLSEILHVLSEKEINVEYMYAFVSVRSGKALMVVQTDDPDRTEQILQENGCSTVLPSDIYRI